MNKLHKKLFEERVKQQNRKFLAKEIFIIAVAIAIAYIILKSSL
ncbi:MAG: hypothetical protein Q4C35_00970 [Eubacteriales bacterium]|nr:hypothetical protein [Eubacteriales bacterium]MDY4007695.1 hypothetical protein [Candidatus Limiplasma sp.]